ncbi:hypothetical protein [Massilia sp. CF038]|uniref:hypothetical protein n=1 Tax=Massilia sp. CF038 TaxID=1881045 RepID=UPI00091F38A9|nr:hypothetical protein [Massilia sp. CF038]SHH24587.1 hypothetical protein SAMN05428948_3494 [Massilia sp. CF038]
MKTLPLPLRLLTLLTLLTVLAGCRNNNDADASPAASAASAAPADEAAQRAEEERSMAEANAAEAKVVARYTAVLLPLLSGSFGSSCQLAQGSDKDSMQMVAASGKDRIQVNAAGLATAPGLELDLRTSTDGLSITRLFENGKPSTAMAMAASTEPDWSFARNSADQESVHLTGVGKAIGCSGAVPTPLRDTPLWPLVEGFFRQGVSTGACGTGGLARSTQSIKIDPAGVTVGSRSFAFGSGLQLEMVSAGPGKGLNYHVAYTNGKKFNIKLDGEGHFHSLMAAGDDGVELDCSRPAG